MSTVSDTKPWYRQFWPWLLISIPAATVVAGFFTIYIASREPVALVHDDYYKEGLAVNRDLAKDRAAIERGLSARLVFDTTGQHVRAAITGRFDGAELNLAFIHPQQIKLDQTIRLQRQPDGTFTAASTVAADRWYLEIEPLDRQEPWRLKGEIDLRAVTTVELQSSNG